MARRRSTPTLRPDPPLGPREFEPAPSGLEAGAVWDCVVATADTVVPETVSDPRILESRWEDGDLVGRRLTGLRVRDTHFVRCDLSGAVLDGAVLDRVAFTGCRMIGTVLSGAVLTHVLVSGCRADELDLRMARARRLLVEDTSLRGADLHELSAPDCAFLGCDLSRADVHGARLTGTRMHGSALAELRGALALRGTHVGAHQLIDVGSALVDALEIVVDQGPAG